MLYKHNISMDFQIVSSLEVLKRNFRIDPSQYNQHGEKIVSHLKQEAIKTEILGNKDQFKEAFLPNRFSRAYTDDPSEGVPMLGTSSMMMMKLPEDSRIRIDTEIDRSALQVLKGDILISRSGTVGTTVHCGESFTNFVASDDCIRLRVDESLQGYLTAYIKSPFGQTLLVRNAHGKVIKHIKPEDIRQLRLPVLEEKIVNKINSDMLKVTDLFEEARNSLRLAEEELYKELAHLIVPKIKHEGQINLKSSLDLLNFRLDPHLYNPTSDYIMSTIKKGSYELLGEIANVWGAPRFKRHKTENNHGTALYSSSDIMRAKLIPSAYISNKLNARNIAQCKIEADTILIPCSGTYGGILGRAVKVGKIMDGKVLTQHVLRVKLKDKKVDPDYVATFLSSFKIGYPLITAARFGKDIPEIAPEDLSKLPIPLIPFEKQKKIGDLMRKATNAQDQANLLEDDIQSYLAKSLNWN